MYEKGMKTVSDSQVETIHQLRYIDINGQGRLFGGRLLEWIDETAALAAERHAGSAVTLILKILRQVCATLLTARS